MLRNDKHGEIKETISWFIHVNDYLKAFKIGNQGTKHTNIYPCESTENSLTQLLIVTSDS